MGCVSQNSRSIAQQLKTLGTVPADSHTLNPSELPLLQISFILEDIKLRKCEYKEIALRFNIEGVDEYFTSFKRIDTSSRVVWRVSHQIESKMTEYDLRMKFLVIEAYDKHKRVLGSININLYLIWRGPCHLNLPLMLQDSKETRVSFNLKISQGVHIVIDNILTRMVPNVKKASGQLYTFWIEPIINQQLEPAKYSYFLKIDDGKNAITKARKYPDQQEDILLSILELGMTKIHSQKDISQVYTASNENIVWEKEKAKDLLLPQINKVIYSHEVRYTTLYLIFFHVIPEKDYNFEIDSSCYISFTKLMDGESKIVRDEATKISYREYKVELSQKTWLHGREVGEARVVLKMKVQNHEQQMLTCVRTEKGIQTTAPIFTNSKSSQNQEISQMKELHTVIQKDLLEFERLGHEHSQARDLFSDIKNDISKMIKILSRSSKDSVLLYEYTDQLEMVEGQRLLIDVALKAHAYIQQGLNPQVQALCWQILMLFLKRGEFTLVNIGFKKQQMEEVFNNKINQVLRVKIEVGISYCNLLNLLLETTLKMLVKQGEEAETAFVQAFCSYGYFRIPKFREIIIQSIHRDSDPEIEEWRAITFDLKDHSHSRQVRESEDYFTILFNWEHNFYKCLSSQSDCKVTISKLRQIMDSQHGWKDRLSRRRGAFFTFLQNLIKEIDYVTVVSKYIEWQYLPGYSRLLYAFLAEMKMTKVIQMTDRFKRCLLRMLSNEKLLNVFIVMLMKKTNIYDYNSTMATLSILDDCFKRLKKTQRSIPTTFDYKFLLSGIKVVLDSDYEFNIEKALIILYNHFNFFVNQFSLELILYLLSKYFFKFFFHWSHNLRKIFHTLVYAKVHMLREKQEGSLIQKKRSSKNSSKTSRSLSSALKSTESTPYNEHLKIFIIQRFQYLMSVVRQQILPSVLNDEVNKMFCQHNLHKQMKHKLALKKTLQSARTSQTYQKQKSTKPALPTVRYLSESVNKKMIVTKHKIYFRPEEMEVVQIEPTQRIYVKQSVDQYKLLMQQLQKKYLEDPEYEPELIAKKTKDGQEKDLEQAELDEW